MDKPNTIPWPPILYGTAILSGVLLGIYYPLPWISGIISDLAFMLGLILIATAIFIDVRTFLELRKHKTTIMPNQAANHLVTSGPFSFSRNPIYLSNTILTFGIGMASQNVWLFGTGLLAAIATNHLAILREEKHLSHKFGNAWHKYSKRVRRWI
ncbi:MAG: isoprenylcysteine carboxylmethyltransferase family protein [Salaquimonas sp.]